MGACAPERRLRTYSPAPRRTTLHGCAPTRCGPGSPRDWSNSPKTGRGAPLLRSVEPVAGVAEPGDDEATLVQATIHGRAQDVHVRVLAVYLLDPRRRRDDADERHRLRPRVLHRCDSRAARVAGREHRVEDDCVPFGEIVRQLEVVLDGLERLLVPIQ